MKKIQRKKDGILFLLARIDLGGSSRRIQVYCNYIDKERYKPIVAITSTNIHRDIDIIIGKNTPRIITADMHLILQFSLDNNVKIVYFFYDGNYNESLYQLISLLKENGIKTLANNIFSYYDKRMDDICDLVFFQTQMMLAIKFIKNFPTALSNNKYVVLPNPIDVWYLSTLYISPFERNKVREKLGFSESDFVVGRFGREDVVKWGDLILDSAFSPRLASGVKFLLVGVPRSRRLLIFLLKMFNEKIKKSVKVLRPTADDVKLMSLMQSVDIIGHSVKIGEACSNAINEAMFWGKPVITNSTPHCDNGQVEQIDDNITGYVANSSDEWVTLINFLNKNPNKKNELGECARKKTLEKWDGKQVTMVFMYYCDAILDKSSVIPKEVVSHGELIQYRRKYFQMKYNQTTQNGFSVMSFIKRVIDFGEHRLDQFIFSHQ